jgi:hypothetical protein
MPRTVPATADRTAAARAWLRRLLTHGEGATGTARPDYRGRGQHDDVRVERGGGRGAKARRK